MLIEWIIGRDSKPKELFPEKIEKSPDPEKEKKETRYASLSSTVILQKDNKKETVCYNCAKTGHSFMDCVNGCGRCGKPGHRTLDCNIVRK